MKVAPGLLKNQHESSIKPLPWIKARRQETILGKLTLVCLAISQHGTGWVTDKEELSLHMQSVNIKIEGL